TDPDHRGGDHLPGRRLGGPGAGGELPHQHPCLVRPAQLRLLQAQRPRARPGLPRGGPEGGTAAPGATQGLDRGRGDRQDSGAAYRQEDSEGSRQEGLMVTDEEQPSRAVPAIPGHPLDSPLAVPEALRAGIGLADGVPGALTDVRDAIAWAAPEVLDGRSRGSVASDVYS